MDDTLPPLSLLAALFRARRSGVLALGSGELGDPPPRARRADRRPRARRAAGGARSRRPAPARRLRRDAARARPARDRHPQGGPSASRPAAGDAGSATGLLDALSDPDLPATFDEGAPAPADVAEVAGATEPLILEAVRRLRGEDAVERLLGDLDRRLVATTALAEERTLTLTEGYILSRIDGVSTARQVLELVPLDPDETQRTMLGLLLTGRVESRAALVPAGPPRAPPPSRPPTRGGARAGRCDRVDGESPRSPPRRRRRRPAGPEASRAGRARRRSRRSRLRRTRRRARGGRPPAALDPPTLARRREVLEIFQSLPLKNHFEVLGVEPGCTDADVRQRLLRPGQALPPRRPPRRPARRPARRARGGVHPRAARPGRCWATRGAARPTRRGPVSRGAAARRRAGPAAASPATPATPPADDFAYVSPEETLLKAQLLMAQARYWDAIQVLETAIPRLEPRRHQLRGRILLARAYAKNPNWAAQGGGAAPGRRAGGPRQRRRALRAGAALQGRRASRPRPGDVPPGAGAAPRPPRGRGRARARRRARVPGPSSSGCSGGARPLDRASGRPRRAPRARRRRHRPRSRRPALHVGERRPAGRSPPAAGRRGGPRRRGGDRRLRGRRGRARRAARARRRRRPLPPWPPIVSPGASKPSTPACGREPSRAGAPSPGATSRPWSPPPAAIRLRGRKGQRLEVATRGFTAGGPHAPRAHGRPPHPGSRPPR